MTSHEDTILVIEDDRALREGLALNFELHGYQVETAADGEEGMRKAFDIRPDLILLDIMLPVGAASISWPSCAIVGRMCQCSSSPPAGPPTTRSRASRPCFFNSPSSSPLLMRSRRPI